jgi:hypothetical protein
LAQHGFQAQLDPQPVEPRALRQFVGQHLVDRRERPGQVLATGQVFGPVDAHPGHEFRRFRLGQGVRLGDQGLGGLVLVRVVEQFRQH